MQHEIDEDVSSLDQAIMTILDISSLSHSIFQKLAEVRRNNLGMTLRQSVALPDSTPTELCNLFTKISKEMQKVCNEIGGNRNNLEDIPSFEQSDDSSSSTRHGESPVSSQTVSPGTSRPCTCRCLECGSQNTVQERTTASPGQNGSECLDNLTYSDIIASDDTFTESLSSDDVESEDNGLDGDRSEQLPADDNRHTNGAASNPQLPLSELARSHDDSRRYLRSKRVRHKFGTRHTRFRNLRSKNTGSISSSSESTGSDSVRSKSSRSNSKSPGFRSPLSKYYRSSSSSSTNSRSSRTLFRRSRSKRPLSRCFPSRISHYKSFCSKSASSGSTGPIDTQSENSQHKVSPSTQVSNDSSLSSLSDDSSIKASSGESSEEPNSVVCNDADEEATNDNSAACDESWLIPDYSRNTYYLSSDLVRGADMDVNAQVEVQAESDSSTFHCVSDEENDVPAETPDIENGGSPVKSMEDEPPYKRKREK